MRVQPLFFLGLLVFMSLQGATLYADESLQLREAKRDLELAEIDYRQFLRVDYPLEELRLESKVTLNQAEMDSIRRRLAEYEPMDRLRGFRPLFVEIENLQLALLELELQQKILDKEGCILRASRRDRLRQFQLKIEAANDLIDSIQASLSEG